MADPVADDARRGARFGARAVLAAVALGLVAVPFSLLLLWVEAQWAPLLHADQAARDDLHAFALAHAGFVTAMEALSTIGSWRGYLIGFAVVLGWLLWRRLVRSALFVVVTVGGSGLLNEIVKAAVHRARPLLTDPVAHESGTSFPSGHAQGAVVGYAVLLLVLLPVLRKAARPIAVAAALLMVFAIGFSRVALGVHYMSDVLAGYVLGAAWVAAMIASFDMWQRDALSPASAASPTSRPARGGRGTPAPSRTRRRRSRE
jgi:membrane-associated phospholipid phosphatase